MPPISAFIGRDAERSRLTDLAIAQPLVTIVGPGGIGKTRLAQEVCAEIAGTFPAGVHRCDLTSIAPRDDVGAEVAGLLGFPSLEAFVVGVGDEPGLLLLDNCEHVLDAVAALCAELLVASPTLHVLATSRAPLGVDGEQIFVLAPLALPASAERSDVLSAAAVRLFENRARAAGAAWQASDQQLAATAELCRRLDGLPLAIELAAARSRALTPSEMLEQLDRRFDLLRRSGAAGSDRHRSLRAAIDASYEHLEPEEQAFLRALGVFAGPFDAVLAHAVAAPPGCDRAGAIDLLSRLVDRSLVTVRQPRQVTRYRLLETIRHYALERLRTAGEEEALSERFVEAMVAQSDALVATALERWSGRVLEAALAMFANLPAAIDFCIARDASAERALRLLLPGWGMVHQGRAAEVAALCARVFARWPEGAEPLRAETLGVSATAHLMAGRVAEARALADAALAHAGASGLARTIAHRALGFAARHLGDVDGAARSFRAARDLAAASGLEPFRRELEGFDALVTGAGGDVDGALARLANVVASAAASGDAINEILAGLVTCNLLLGADRPAEAMRALEAVERVQQEVDYPFGNRAALRLRAVLATLERGWDGATDGWRTAIEHTAACGDLSELPVTLRTAAALAARAGRRAAAADLLAAVPAGVHLAILPGLFEDDLGALPAPPAAARAISAAEAMRRVREVLVAGGAAGEETAPGRAPSGATGALLREGDTWTARYAGRSVQLRGAKGLDDIAALLAAPDREVHCLELMGGADAGGDAGPRMDDRARREYRARVRELQAEIDDAQSANDLARAERAEAELDALVQQLAQAFGLGGRSRPAGSAAERARSAVTWRVRAAIKRVRDVHPELGRHLENAVRTGTWCTYRPETPVAWEVRAS